jgi:N-acetylmuramic acid 6-phosphate etherase
MAEPRDPPPSPPPTEAAHPDAHDLEGRPTAELLALMNREDARVTSAVAAAAPSIARAIDAIAERLRDGGRLLYFGAGTSGRLGVLDAAECPPTFGTPPGMVVGVIAGGAAALTRAQEGAEDDQAAGAARVAELAVGARDAVVGISASGRTPFVLGALAAARAAGAFTVALACNPGSDLAAAAELAIEAVVGPEVVAGSTRLKAGTATKLVLNQLSTGVMVRLGRVEGHRMVDLRPTNAKLLERATRMVVELAGVDRARALAALAAGRSVREAVAALREHATGASSTNASSAGWIAGIDGGGTKTAVALGAPIGADRPLPALRLAQPCNLATDLDAALDSIVEALDLAFAAAGERRAPLAALLVAAAGAGDPQLRARAADRLRRRGIAREVAILHDAAPWLAAATPAATGVVLLSGTGSFCFGRDKAGRCARAGGLGAILGDDGSACELGRAALRLAARAADGRAARLALANAIFERVGSDDPRTIVRHAHARGTPAELAALAPLVLHAAEGGDPIAARLIRRAADELALMAKTVARRLDFRGEALPLVLGGGVFDHGRSLRQGVVAAMRGMGVAADVLPAGDPAAGALMLARELLAGRLAEGNWFPS